MTLTRAFCDQAESCAALDSPFMARLMRLCAERLTRATGAVAAALHDWPGDVSSWGTSLPLRLAGGLHALVLRRNAALAAVYPPREADDDALWRACAGSLRQEETFLLDWVGSPPQTNEIRRAAVLRAIGHWLAARHALPLDLCELGASAGLNLHRDRYAMTLAGTRFGPADPTLTLSPVWSGPLPPAVEPVIASRRGVDLNPPSPAMDALRLRAYLRADQPRRMARTDAALALPPAPVDRGDAADRLDALPPQAPGTTRLICHTIAWQYFPPDTQARATARIGALGAAASAEATLAHLGRGADGGRGAALTLHLWPGRLSLDAGRADFHGRRVEWRLNGRARAMC